jgi:hypothetical protein
LGIWHWYCGAQIFTSEIIMNKKNKRQLSKTEKQIAQVTLERDILNNTLKDVLARFDAKNLFDSLLSKIHDSLKIENYALEGSEHYFNYVKTNKYQWDSAKDKNKYLKECRNEIKKSKGNIKKMNAIKNALLNVQNLYIKTF